MSDTTDAFTEWASQPFRPDQMQSNGTSLDPGDRIAVALEYIAAQLGEICRKMDHVGSGCSASREDFEEMNRLLRKL